ncbi:LPS export ABC transporter periplasmic protein LptC [Hydrogenophaga sp. 5NK40-0174]|uniref:LPS export ABC transporter periplasmic protein LptC n=1 Tax=Hydrogenophaga sp. 5NK40-0174 TaxID=3127649 RepID=UPI00310C45AF
MSAGQHQHMAMPNQADQLPLAASSAGATGVRRRDRLSRLFDQVSIYLPVVLMLLVALGSYWLLRSTPEPVIPEPERELVHEPDSFMRGFSVRVFNASGMMRSEVYGAEARHYPDNGETEVDSARVRAYTEDGQLTVANADTITSNAPGTKFELRGNGVVIRQAGVDPDGIPTPRMEFHGEYLHLTTMPERIFSDQPVLIIRGTDQMKADSLRYWGDLRRLVRMKGRVQATIQPGKK